MWYYPPLSVSLPLRGLPNQANPAKLKTIPPYKRGGKAPSAQRLSSVCLAPTNPQTRGDMSRVGVDYIQDYFLPSFTYGLGMITPYPDMANSVGCPAGTHVSTRGCSPRESEGDTQTTHRRTKSKRSPPQLALRLWANLFSLSGGELPR